MWGEIDRATGIKVDIESIIKDLHYEGRYDLLITEALANNQEHLLELGYRLRIPTSVNINIGPLSDTVSFVHGNDPQLLRYLDPKFVNPYVPYLYTLLCRLLNYLFGPKDFGHASVNNIRKNKISLDDIHNNYILKLQKDRVNFWKVNKENPFPFKGPPSFIDLAAHVSLTVANFHPAIGYLQTLPPNIVPIPGIHIAKDPDYQVGMN